MRPGRTAARASGTSVVFPVPGGATSTADPRAERAPASAGSTDRTGRSVPGVPGGGSTGPVSPARRRVQETGAMSLGTAVLTFSGVAVALTLTPGLDTALVLRSALTRHRREAAATAAGIVAGLLVWGAAAAIGVSALLTASQLAYDVL